MLTRRYLRPVKNFIIFFDEKEGTTAIIRMLARFPAVGVVRKDGKGQWEPFDRHACGRMRLGDLRACLDRIYGERPLKMDRLNAVYSKTAGAPLHPVETDRSVGFKMRFTPPEDRLPVIGHFRIVDRLATRRHREFQIRHGPFRRMMFDLLRRHDVTAFVAARQDVLRWALSKYHGDGTAKPGHLQFQLAKGAIKKADLPPINVDLERLGTIIDVCERRHESKQALMRGLLDHGVRAAPLLYEKFVVDRTRFFDDILRQLEVVVPRDEIDRTLSAGETLQRVHSDDISEFVTNHEDVLARYGQRYVSWQAITA
jgi:hypothetical protein